jgi:hypothetical protein
MSIGPRFVFVKSVLLFDSSRRWVVVLARIEFIDFSLVCIAPTLVNYGAVWKIRLDCPGSHRAVQAQRVASPQCENNARDPKKPAGVETSRHHFCQHTVTAYRFNRYQGSDIVAAENSNKPQILSSSLALACSHFLRLLLHC